MSIRCNQHNKGGQATSACGHRVKRAVALCLWIGAVHMATLGCSEADKRKWQYYTPEQNFSTALDSTDGNLRREAVTRIGQSTYFTSADAFHVLDAAARTDPVAQVRCVAIRILGRYEDDRPTKTLLTILTASGPGGEALEPTDDVRWDAAEALVSMQAKGLLNEQDQSAACQLFIQFLRSDRSRNVRVTAARALGEFKDRQVFPPLIEALRNKDFMIADNAERSLMALTGTTHDYDAEAWSQWLGRIDDPFSDAGKPVAATRPAAAPTWWDEQQRMWRRAIKLGE